MELEIIFMIISYIVGSIVGVIIWEFFVREKFKKK